MTSETIKQVITNEGGPEYVLGFRFANGYKLVYSRQLINLEEDFITVNGVELLKFEHVDWSGNKAHSLLEVNEITQIYFRDKLDDDDHKLCIRDFME